LDAVELRFEDWKMTKNRIKHFDDIVMKTRVQGIPIATAIQAAAFVSAASVGKIETTIFNYQISVFSIIILSSLTYLVPVLLLDIFHFKLLLKAVKHASKIEEEEPFKGKLEITHKLTSRGLSVLHSLGGYGTYFVIFLAGFYFAFIGSHDIITNLVNITPHTP
jgi:hypothetical protein